MITAIGDAVVSKINASGLLDSGETAVRKIVPRLDVDAAGTLQVLVITPTIERVRQNRTAFRNNLTVQAGVIKQVSAVTPAVVDPLIALAEGILNLTFDPVSDGGRRASFFASISEPLYDADRLEQLHTFVSVITIQFTEFQ